MPNPRRFRHSTRSPRSLARDALSDQSSGSKSNDTRFSGRATEENGALNDPASESKSKGEQACDYYVYILRCADGTLYTGSTTDVVARERAHNRGCGAKYTAGRGPVRVVYFEAHESRSAAQKREAQLKRWTRKQKDALIKGFSPSDNRGLS